MIACEEELSHDDAEPPACEAVNDWHPAQVELENRVVELINEQRKLGTFCGEQFLFPTHALEQSPSLRCAARLHSQSMQKNDFFAYIDPNDINTPEPQDLLREAGYESQEWEQNIAAGWPSAETVVKAWLASENHCKKLFEPKFTEIGVGVVEGEESNEYPIYWTLFLGNE